MLKLYDNDLLSSFDKASLKSQEIAYLNASFALEQPVPEIIPRRIYRYNVDLNNIILSDCVSMILKSYRIDTPFSGLSYNQNIPDYSHLWPLFVDVNRETYNSTRDFTFKTAEYGCVYAEKNDDDNILRLNNNFYDVPVEFIDSSSCILFHREKVAYLPLIRDKNNNAAYYYSSSICDPVKAISKVLRQTGFLEKEGYYTSMLFSI